MSKGKGYSIIPFEVSRKIPLPEGYHEGLRYDSGSIWVSNGQGGKIWIVNIESGEIASSIEPIAGFTEAVTQSPDGGLVVTDWDEKKVYRATLTGGRLVPESSVSVAPAHPAGAEWCGGRLFIITWTRGLGTRFALLEMTEDLETVRRIAVKNIQEPAHLAWDGKHLWITSWYSSMIYKVDIGRMEILGYFKAPVAKATGIAWDGAFLWLTGTYGDLYQVKV